MRRTAGMLMAAVLLVGATLSAQTKANFSGKWTLVPDPNAAAAGGGGGGGGGRMGGGRGGMGGGGGFSCGAECTITQDASMLKLERMQGQNPVAITVKLDGSESKNSQTMGQMAIESTSKATWDGAKLVITTMTNMNGNMAESKTVLSMDGANMVIESTRPGRQGGEPTVTKQTYKK